MMSDEDKTIKKSLDLITFLFSSFIILHSSLAFVASFRGGRTVLVPRYVEKSGSFLEALPVTRNWQHAASFESSCLETVHFLKNLESIDIKAIESGQGNSLIILCAETLHSLESLSRKGQEVINV
jgi:hypothetical protein